MLYVIACEHAVKIGISADPARRLVGLQHASPFEMHLVLAFECADEATLERLLRNHYTAHRLRGEWYDTTILPGLPRTVRRLARRLPPSAPIARRDVTSPAFRYSPERLVACGVRWHETFGRWPRVADWTGVRGGEWPSFLTCVRAFGTWRQYLQACREAAH